MVNLFDIVRNAQSGRGLHLLSRQFGLSMEQTQLAVEALLPAFSLALQRRAEDPADLARFLGTVMSGRFEPFWTGASPAPAAGPDLVAQFLGSPEIGRRVAEQAAGATGLATELMQRMLPHLSATLMGGLFHVSAVDGFADFLRTWADWLGKLRPAETRAPPAAFTPYRAWSELMGSFLAGTRPRAPASPPRPVPPSDPWASFTQAYRAASQPPPPPPPEPSALAPNPFEALAHMVEVGREVQAQHAAGLRAIFDALWLRPDGSGIRPS